MPLLTTLLLMPMLGAGWILLQRGGNAQKRTVAILFSGLTLVIALLVLALFDHNNTAIQFSETMVWNARMGTSYAVGIDGIALSMVLLATLLVFVAILASGTIQKQVSGYYALILFLESAMIGVFIARDWALFYVFWEMTLIPLFFLIDRWGGVRRSRAALNFVLYTMGGSVFMLISLLVLFDAMPDHSFSMAAMTETARTLPASTQLFLFLGFLVGFGVKMPIFPLHGWLPLAHVEAPAPISILLSGILLKMGAYGLILASSMLPLAILELQTELMVLALLGLIYGGLLAWRQSDLKSMVAYSSVSHMGVVLFGISTLNIAGLTGAVFQMVAHGLVAGALFLLIGLLYQRTHTRNINDYRSLIDVAPRFALFTSLALFGAIGIPGSAGFIAEFHAIVGGFERWGWITILLSLGVMISASYAVRTLGVLFTGPSSPRMAQVQDLNRSELSAAAVLILLMLWIGLYPTPALEMLELSIQQMLYTPTLISSAGGAL
ncbi:MAG: NADH-quinone oxidoreductase subunit M [Gammaproteobacteria bacterium]|jgi:NADH-quinone oxidoreductase subunit M|nr:NADH-quinone oxidoreductase subunit M [Gammaproteobacteria bacterium]MBT4607848.1 NADH-quinone oxidoreductase subunit M [Thiotrichales bacterium]MBT3473143.1 NADH-quinone oxidoreductase subunit M [Gammaproteobacteria bacterium]MBT3966968.1 NADH-quinone oxidoreductase subunit M [Gammaproteobacteria bacterium]MBT4081587.1 NADH-quinone oxidoreductase subunit M [Gammaproteobacteria bacterium]